MKKINNTKTILKNTTMKNTIYENGVYIYAERKLYKPEEFTGGEGKVIIVMGSDAFEVSPEQVKNVTWMGAMKFAKSKGGNLPDRVQRMLMRKFQAQIQLALEKIGGTLLLENSWEWLCEEYSSYSAWSFYGGHGGMCYYGKYCSCSGRPLLDFQFNELAD